ncbi:cytochrome P450 [Schizopora paradoxa]|uniref:Cytochrome P450 n=1 Tax=Schizopora paradoxa TaxID=27342 RepID=A0A0H2S558_9AGAM|nr:cytochrome P450 [Schizopora paradoxa]
MPTPGVIFLSRWLFRISIAPTILYWACHALITVFELKLSQAALAVVCLSSTPLLAFVNAVRRSLKRRNERNALGAVDVPKVVGKGWPGNIDLLIRIKDSFEKGYPAEAHWDITRKHGYVFNLKPLGLDQIYTLEPEHLKRVLAADFNGFEKGKVVDQALRSILGSGVFNSDGELWRFHRTMTRPFFSRERIFYFQIFENHASHAIRLVKHRLSEGYAVDLHDVSCRFTLDCASQILLGSCVCSLGSGLPYPHNALPELHAQRAEKLGSDDAAAFAEAFNRAQASAARRPRLGFLWPLWEILKDKTKEDMSIVDAYLGPILSGAYERKRQAAVHTCDKGIDEDINDDETLLQYLLKCTDDMKLIKEEILNILIAGRDTSSSTIGFAIYCLSRNPEYLYRLRAEIDEFVGNTRLPSYEEIKNMKFLRAVINETLRLYPPVMSIDSTTLPSTVPGGQPFYIPAETKIIYSVFMMHRREDLWGPDASIFDPNRFLDDRARVYHSNPFIFLPFNAGPRICLGQRFAYVEISYFIIRLFQTFSSVELDLLAQPPNSRPSESWKTVPGRQSSEQIFPKCNLILTPLG